MSKNLSKATIARGLVGLTAGYASYNVAKATIKNNLAEPETKIQKIAVFVGTAALAGVASMHAEKYVVGAYDDILKTVKTTAAEASKTQSQS